jgi:hypothetical protein
VRFVWIRARLSKAQDGFRKKDPAKYAKVYGIGMTESATATDTIWNFEMALLSYGGQVFNVGSFARLCHG